MQFQQVVLASAILIIIVGLSSCTNSGTASDKPLTGAAIKISQGNPIRESGKAIRLFDMKVSDSGFEPMNIEAKKGETVRIRLTAEGSDHYFILNDFDISEGISAGKQKIIEFVAEEKGIHNFHSSQFMGNSPVRGQLIVTN